MAEALAENFLRDLVYYLRDQTKEPLVEESGDYQRGYQFGLYVVMDHIKNQAEVWGITKEAIGFGDFNPGKWFLALPHKS